MNKRIYLTGCDTATYGIVTIKGRGMASPIGPLCRKLLSDCIVGPFEMVEIWRGETLCFPAQPLVFWASMHTSEGVHSQVKTTVYKPNPMFEGSA